MKADAELSPMTLQIREESKELLEKYDADVCAVLEAAAFSSGGEVRKFVRNFQHRLTPDE